MNKDTRYKYKYKYLSCTVANLDLPSGSTHHIGSIIIIVGSHLIINNRLALILQLEAVHKLEITAAVQLLAVNELLFKYCNFFLFPRQGHICE